METSGYGHAWERPFKQEPSCIFAKHSHVVSFNPVRLGRTGVLRGLDALPGGRAAGSGAEELEASRLNAYCQRAKAQPPPVPASVR